MSGRRRAEPPARQSNRRIRLLFAGIALLLCLLTARTLQLQVLDHTAYAQEAFVQQREQRPLWAPRGAITDRNGVALALSVKTYKLTLDRGHIHGVDAISRAIAQIVPETTVRSVRESIYGASNEWPIVARGLDTGTRDRIAADPLLGPLVKGRLIGFIAEPLQRVYPHGAAVGQLVGFVNSEGTKDGAEASLDRYLRSKDGVETALTFKGSGEVARTVKTTPPVAGHDVRLSIDEGLNDLSGRVLEQTIATWHARSGTAVMLDPSTGETIALASAPTLPDGGFSAGTDESRRMRWQVDIYEPGSAFKAIVFSAALDAGVITPGEMFKVPASKTVVDENTGKRFTISDLHGHVGGADEHWTAAKILAVSSNVGTILIAQKLGKERFAAAIRRFGFGKYTGIDLPAESKGRRLPEDQWYGTGLMSNAIGEGLAATPIQMAAFYGAIANGGVLIQPHIAAAVDGKATTGWTRHRIISERTAATMRRLLRGPVEDPQGTANAAQIPGLHVAGKTGTTPRLLKNGTFCNRFNLPANLAACPVVASFVGMVPAEHPKFVLLVMIDDPKVDATHPIVEGGVVAAPAFHEIATRALSTFGIVPSVG